MESVSISWSISLTGAIRAKADVEAVMDRSTALADGQRLLRVAHSTSRGSGTVLRSARHHDVEIEGPTDCCVFAYAPRRQELLRPQRLVQKRAPLPVAVARNVDGSTSVGAGLWL